MNTDKSFKNFRVLDILKNNEKWQEHSQALSARTREQVATGMAGTGKVRIPTVGQGKMKVHISLLELIGLTFIMFAIPRSASPAAK